jgi:hypothetical protein
VIGPARPGVDFAPNVVFPPWDAVVWLVACDDDLCELLCDDELWLELLDFAPAGTMASAMATTAMDKDKASLVFGIVIPREYESPKDKRYSAATVSLFSGAFAASGSTSAAAKRSRISAKRFS